MKIAQDLRRLVSSINRRVPQHLDLDLGLASRLLVRTSVCAQIVRCLSTTSEDCSALLEALFPRDCRSAATSGRNISIARMINVNESFDRTTTPYFVRTMAPCGAPRFATNVNSVNAAALEVFDGSATSLRGRITLAC